MTSYIPTPLSDVCKEKEGVVGVACTTVHGLAGKICYMGKIIKELDSSGKIGLAAVLIGVGNIVYTHISNKAMADNIAGNYKFIMFTGCSFKSQLERLESV